MGLDAAELQKRHALEGAPDPFPSLQEGNPVKSVGMQEEVDTDSHTAFPSLAPSAAPAVAPTRSAWGTDAGPRIKANVKTQPMVSDSFTLTVQLPVNKNGKTVTLGEVMKQVMAKFKVKVEASANQRTRQTTFHIKSESQKDLEKAKRNLLASLSPVVTVTVPAPASTIPSIVGPKGANLNRIREQTSVKIDVPRKDEVSPVNGSASHVHGEDDEEPTVPVKIIGPQPLALEAQALLNEIISSRTANTTQRVKDIPAHILPFVLPRRASFIEAAHGVYVNLALNAAEREISVSGDREAVLRVVETIKGAIDSFKAVLTHIKLSLPKRQHRLLVGKALDEIMRKSKCTVIVPEDSSEEVTVYGKAEDLPTGLAAVMEQANSQYIHEFPLPGPITVSRQLLTYMTRIDYIKGLSADHPGALVFTPSVSAIAQAAVLNIDIVGEKSVVDAVVRQVSELLGKLIGATKEVTISWPIQQVIIGRYAKKLQQFHDDHNVQVFFPPESAEQSSVLLVYDPFFPAASPSPVEKEKHLNAVSQELLQMSKEAADVKSETISAEKQWHGVVLKSLDSIIGGDTGLSVKIGAEAGDATTEDIIFLRGISTDVDRAVKEIIQLVEDAKNDAILSSYFTEFDIDKEYVGRVIGTQGAGIHKLREQLSVKVDLFDDVEEKESSKRKKTTQRTKVKITGREENVEEAKMRILAQVERLADETSEILKIPVQYHASLIGQSGKYVIRLEDKYGVKITFPRQSLENSENKTREHLKPDEVHIKGGKKGVAGAKSELMEALEFEKESNNILQFTVPTRAVSRILGRGGATINEIKDDTGAQIDIDKNDDQGVVTQITVRGTKKAISAAKTAILAISDKVGEEITTSIVIENKYHGTIIGPGGQALRDLIARCGGPSDPKLQVGLLRFPRQGEPSDEVRLRGEPGLVQKIKDELEKAVATLRDRVVLAVEVPATQHRNLIGRGGQHLNDLQNRTGVQIQFPGSRSYDQVGEPVNGSEMEGVDPANIVKVSGSRSACEATIGELKAQIKTPPAPVESATATISVPLKYHHAISQQGSFFRKLRSYGVHVEQSPQPQKSAVPTQPPETGASTARIDDAEESPGFDWRVVPNHQDAEEGDSNWTLRAKDAAGLERAQGDIQSAIEQAEAMSHVGFLTLPDRSAFPRIVGTKGSNVTRLRAETGADITVSRENNTIVIIGVFPFELYYKRWCSRTILRF
ncbi:hypothetical protein F5I97DRAFT_1853381 [Phlebopus sp. FC_14]|nr:hypothetical protein F5I97DRAFT_1853381 [Phlebopus sp. FC_14]